MSMQKMDSNLGMANKRKKVYLELTGDILPGLASGPDHGLAG
jgi:hypothetical protein